MPEGHESIAFRFPRSARYVDLYSSDLLNDLPYSRSKKTPGSEPSAVVSGDELAKPELFLSFLAGASFLGL
jgi:hypothetical protein